MIARVWHCITKEAHAEVYLALMEKTGIAAYRSTEGNRGVWVLKRICSGVAEFQVISFWDSHDAIRRFTNSDDINMAVYYPDDYKYLLYPEPRVTHYDLAIGDFERIGNGECTQMRNPRTRDRARQ